MMTVNEAVASVQFVVDNKGEPTAALLDISMWRVIVTLLEEAEDQGLFQAYVARRRKASSPEGMGLILWEEVEAALGGFLR